MASAPPPMHFISSSKTLVKTLIAILHTRLQILALDIEEDRIYLLRLFNMLCLTIVALGMALLMLNTILIVFFWEHHRLMTLSGLAIVYLCIGVYAWRRTIIRMRTKPKLFETSLSELVKDWQAIERPIEEDATA